MLTLENSLGLPQTYLSVGQLTELRLSHMDELWSQLSHSRLHTSCSQGKPNTLGDCQAGLCSLCHVLHKDRPPLALHQCTQHTFIFYKNWWSWGSETPSHLCGTAKHLMKAVSRWNLEVCKWSTDSQLLGTMNLGHCILRSRLTTA